MIILVRHPPTTLNDTGRVRGQLDPPLSPEGQEVVRKTASQFLGVDIDRIYTDDTIRTKTMAAGIAKVTKAPVVITDKLRTWNLGDFAGKKITDVEERIRDYMLKTPAKAVPGGESFEAFATHYLPFLKPHFLSDKTVVFVTHGRTIMTTKAWQKADGQKAPMDLAGDDLSPEPDTVEPGGIAIVSKTQPFKVIL